MPTSLLPVGVTERQGPVAAQPTPAASIVETPDLSVFGDVNEVLLQAVIQLMRLK
jgi:hypothetical protein